MSGWNRHEHLEQPDFVSSADALELLSPLPEGELQFMDRYGNSIERKRTLIALPSGDEVYTGKPAVVWSEDMRPTRMLYQASAVVRAMFKEDDKESEAERS